MKRRSQAPISRFFQPLDLEIVPTQTTDGKKLVTVTEKKQCEEKEFREQKRKSSWWNVQYETKGKLITRIKKDYVWKDYCSLRPLGNFQPAKPTSACITDIKFDKAGILFAVASSDGHVEVHDFDSFILGDLSFISSSSSSSQPDVPTTTYQPNNIYDDLSRQPIRVLSDASKQLPPLPPPLVQLNCGQTLSCIQWNVENQNEIICSFSSFKDIYAYDLETYTNAPTRTFKSRSGSGIFDLAIVEDRKQIIGVGRDCSLQFWDIRSDSKPTTLHARYKRKKPSSMQQQHQFPKRVIAEKKGNGSFNSIQVRRDGNIVYVGTDRGYINVWDIRYTSTVMTTMDIGMLMTKAGFGPRDAASGVSSIALDSVDGNKLGFQLFNSVLGVVDTSTAEGKIVSLYRPKANEGDEDEGLLLGMASTHMGRLQFASSESFLCAAGAGGASVVVANMEAMGLSHMEKLSTMDLLEKKYDKQMATVIAASVGLQFRKEEEAMEKEKRKQEEEEEERGSGNEHVIAVGMEALVTSVACHPAQHYIVSGMQGNELVIMGPSHIPKE